MEERVLMIKNKNGFNLLSTYYIVVLKCSVQNYVIELHYNSVSNDVISTLQMRKLRITVVLCMSNRERGYAVQ